MPAPLEGSVFMVGEKRTLTFVTGFNWSAANNKTGTFINLTNANNNVSFNNSDITVADNATGTVTVPANFTAAGFYTAQFKMATANNNNISYSPLYTFVVYAPLL
jgi:hypothetical protein